ncbi:MAG: hypothetical protein COA65_08175 [Rhodospirillaceae bacterium]|nr:MAG: hypothetical protein COA65_08175 [Rhodospirillaceae bacterium]
MQTQFQKALRLHQQGELADAEKIYRQLLGDAPDSTDAPDVFHALGVLCQQKGENTEAIRCFKDALTRNPNAVDTCFNLGAVLHQQGKFEDAVRNYQRAIDLEPENTGIAYNLADALLALGRFEEAIAAYRIFLDQAPDTPTAHYNLGLALIKSHRFEEAIAAYRAAIAKRPDFPEALANLGTLLMEVGQPDDALVAYRQAFAQNPGLAEAHYNLGNALMGLGKFEEAEIIFREAIRRWPAFATLHLRLSNLKTFSPGDPDIAAMETEFAKPNLDEQQKAIFCFAIGKAHEDCEAYDHAFDYFEKGNALKHASLSFDIDKEETRTNRIIATFNKAFLTGQEGQGATSDMPIFILGMPRSGATLIEQILATHSGVYGAGERQELAHHISKLGGASGSEFPETVLNMKGEDFARLGQAYVDAMARLAPNASHITDKWLQNFHHIGLIHLALPNAKIIHATRNPFDICLASYKCYFDGARDFAYDLTELGKSYKLYQRLMNHWHAVLPGRVFDLSYEGLVTDPETHIRRLLDFCALPWEAACLDFHKTERLVPTASVARVRQPMTTSAVRRWRQYEHRLTPLLEALA